MKGLKGFVTSWFRMKSDLLQALNTRDPILLRVPSPLINAITGELVSKHKPFALEVAADPHDMFAKGSIGDSTISLRPLFQKWFVSNLKRQCLNAFTVKYVTRQALQRRYPTAQGQRAFAVSDAVLPDDAFVAYPRKFPTGARKLIFVGMLEQLYKGQDTLIQAVAKAVEAGFSDIKISFIGDGQFRGHLEEMAKNLGIADNIVFRGVLSRDVIRKELDSSDLFLLPSRQEGTPRALLEAMARALPCIGSDVGGIPELLSSDWTVPPNDVDLLAAKLIHVLKHPELLDKASEDNLQLARTYHDAARKPSNDAFLMSVREMAPQA